MTKATQIFLIALIALITISFPTESHAYLVPLIGGAWWLITIIIAGAIAVAAFIWAHVVKFKQVFKKDKNKADSDAGKTN